MEVIDKGNEMKIELPQLKNNDGEPAFLSTIRFETDALNISITDEAAGAFVELEQVDQETLIVMDGSELVAFAKWADETCKAMDEANTVVK